MILAQAEAFGSSAEKCGSSGSIVDVSHGIPPFQMLPVAWDLSDCGVTLILILAGDSGQCALQRCPENCTEQSSSLH